jgi:hypothetical protein
MTSEVAWRYIIMVSVEWDGQRVLNKFSPTAMLWRGAVY